MHLDKRASRAANLFINSDNKDSDPNEGLGVSAAREQTQRRRERFTRFSRSTTCGAFYVLSPRYTAPLLVFDSWETTRQVGSRPTVDPPALYGSAQDLCKRSLDLFIIS